MEWCTLCRHQTNFIASQPMPPTLFWSVVRGGTGCTRGAVGTAQGGFARSVGGNDGAAGAAQRDLACFWKTSWFEAGAERIGEWAEHSVKRKYGDTDSTNAIGVGIYCELLLLRWAVGMGGRILCQTKTWRQRQYQWMSPLPNGKAAAEAVFLIGTNAFLVVS